MKRAQHHPGGRGGVRFGGGGGGAGGVSPSKMLWATLPWPEYTYQYVWQTLVSQTTGYTRMLPVCTGGSPGHQRHGPEGLSGGHPGQLPSGTGPPGRAWAGPAVRPTPAIATLSDISAPAANRFSVLVVMSSSPIRPVAAAPACCGIAECHHRAAGFLADSWKTKRCPSGGSRRSTGPFTRRPTIRSAPEGRGREAFKISGAACPPASRSTVKPNQLQAVAERGLGAWHPSLKLCQRHHLETIGAARSVFRISAAQIEAVVDCGGRAI
jgi:hypothetical protein